MKHRLASFLLVALFLAAFTYQCPAPLIYKPGEGWVYEKVGSKGRWQRGRAQDQLAVAQEAFDQKDYSTCLKAAKRTVAQWPLSDYAPRALYLQGRSHEAQKKDQMAFQDYQKLIEKYPKIDNYEEVVGRQYALTTRFLNGQWFKLWGVIPFFPSMDKTADMYEKIVKNGPYSDYGPRSQMDIGTAREKQKDYPKAVQAYETAADRYNDQPKVASDALYKKGLAYNREAKTSEYDQNVAGQAIATFTDFITLYPDNPQ